MGSARLRCLPGSPRDASRCPVLHGLLQQEGLREGGYKASAAGLESAPPACTALKKIGVTPITYGSGSAAYSGEFNPGIR